MRITDYRLDHLDYLESDAIFILREVAAQFENPYILFSGGKDSILLIHLAIKAFYPGNVPFPLLHIDTGHNFPETISFRDSLVEKFGLRLKVGSVQEAIDNGWVSEETGINASRNLLQTEVLLRSIESNEIDAAIGGGRRDEEKARAKERIFSHRDEFGQWRPKNQRPELWQLFNSYKKKGEHFRIFPISDWTEIDVWKYLLINEIEVPSLYFAHEREILSRGDILLADSEFISKMKDEKINSETVRCRTIGDMTCTGMWRSDAANMKEIIAEISASEFTERGGRFDDRRSETSMEDRKRLGYF